MYDEELGAHGVVEEHVEKPRARGARLEICFQTPGPKTCSTLAKVSAPSMSASAPLPLKVKETFVLLKDTLSHDVLSKGDRLRCDSSDPIAIGCRPSYVTAKLVLDVPLAQDVIKEVEL